MDFFLPVIFTTSRRRFLFSMRKKSIQAAQEARPQEKSLIALRPVIRMFAEVGTIIPRVLQPEPAMEESAQKEGGHSCPTASKNGGKNAPAPLKLCGQEYVPETWALDLGPPRRRKQRH